MLPRLTGSPISESKSSSSDSTGFPLRWSVFKLVNQTITKQTIDSSLMTTSFKSNFLKFCKNEILTYF